MKIEIERFEFENGFVLFYKNRIQSKKYIQNKIKFGHSTSEEASPNQTTLDLRGSTTSGPENFMDLGFDVTLGDSRSGNSTEVRGVKIEVEFGKELEGGVDLECVLGGGR